MLKQVHVYIKGDVIGVGFRAWTKIQAKIVDIKGWIKNNHTLPEKFGGSGGIEAVIQGPEDRVVEFIDLLRVGPPVAHVEHIEALLEEVKEIYDTFEIKK